MFNPLKMAGDIKGMEKMLKPALEKFLNESGFVKKAELSKLEARIEKLEAEVKNLKSQRSPSSLIFILILVALISVIDLSKTSSSKI